MSSTKKQSSKHHVPTILLVGAGRFGINHLRILKELHTEKKIHLKGVVVRTDAKRKLLEKEHAVKTFSTISASVLKDVDAVDIVTPPETHYELVKKCLPYTNVFVEKPLTTSTKESLELEKLAKKYKKNLSVGHIFRYHSVSEKLKFLLGKNKRPLKIHGSFINPKDDDQGREPSFEFLHLFDIVDFIWPGTPDIVHTRSDGGLSHVHVRYDKNSDAHFILGCTGGERIRTLTFRYKDRLIEADFVLNTIIEKIGDIIKKHECPHSGDLIKKELTHFLSIVKNGGTTRADASVGTRIVTIAEKGIRRKIKTPRVAVIGGGIFGTNIAIHLAPFSKVILFEKNKELMQEGTYSNCFRHHMGFHYPRSSETVLEIQDSKDAFEKLYEESIVRTYPTYYGIAKNGSHISGKDFLTFCRKHNLPFTKASLPKKLLNKNEIDLSVRVEEPGYHFETLLAKVKKRLAKEKNIQTLYEAKVDDVKILKSGKKKVTYSHGKRKYAEEFDYVINSTYANINSISKSMGFEQFPVRVDLTEVLIIRLPIAPISITIIDGPFTTLMPTGNKNEFTLYHVVHSILDRYVPNDGLIKKNTPPISQKDAILRESMKYLPMLKDAVVVESRFAHRGVRAYREHDDNRVSDLIEHGFGCWSILSGKILTGVSLAKKITETIKKETPDH